MRAKHLDRDKLPHPIASVHQWLGFAIVTVLVLVAATLWIAGSAALHAQSTDAEIVYIDATGVIRVRDPNTATGRQPVTWFSPQGNYTHSDLVDANQDGDLEIVALRTLTDANSLDIYDPVVASGSFDPGKVIGFIPWTLLYSLPLDERPALLAVGDLDTASGSEILVSVGREKQQLFYLRRTGTDGKSWERVNLGLPAREWSAVALGNMDASGLDEIALVANVEGRLEVWRLTDGGGVARIAENATAGRPWVNVAMGRWREGDARDFLGAVREADSPFVSFVVYRFNTEEQEVQDDRAEAFSPSPGVIFFGNINAEGDEEAIMLRDALETDTARVRLITRSRDGENMTSVIEDNLGGLNGYGAGATGDIDGDGKNEIVIARSDRLRIFASPEASNVGTDEARSTDARNLAIGDLDRNGYVEELLLVPAPSTVAATVRSGEVGSSTTVTVTGSTPSGATGKSIAFAWSVSGSPQWAKVSANRSVTPATLTVQFDASRLPPGTYTADLNLTSSDPLVLTQPVAVPLHLTVSNGMFLNPASLEFIKVPCTAPFAAQSAALRVEAPAGTIYTASLLEAAPGDAQAAGGTPSAVDVGWPSSVPWASASSPNGVAVENITVVADFAKRTADLQFARLVVIARVDGVDIVRTAPITLMCTNQRTWLPVVDSR